MAGGGFLLGEGGVVNTILKLGEAKDVTIPIDGHSTQFQGAIDGPGAPITVLGTDSLFNPFYIFRYSKFAEGTTINTAGTYKIDSHTQVYDSSKLKTVLGNFKELLKAKNADIIQNPTARTIKDWADKKASEKNGPTYPYPYSLNDFSWCKWYGKIPNNRLLTLRRYTIPVEDNLAVHEDKLPLVPTAQAVTWWGGETNNTLSNVLGMTYGFNWKMTEPTDIQDVAGNELNVEKLLEAIGINNPNLAKAVKLLVADDPNTLTGQDKILQDSLKDQWGSNGAYWNRIKGPVNVINTTRMRLPGYTFTHTIKLTFEYNLRSIGNINPKVAMLDLITNFLSLTHNTATFWGGGYRYYKQTGVLLGGFNTDAFEKGDIEQGIKNVSTMLSSMIQGGATDLKEFFNKLSNDLGDAAGMEDYTKALVENIGKSQVGKNIAASRLSSLMQKPLLMRAILDGRAVGEWHLMVGNPMDPIAVIGNLCVINTNMTFSEELGADDFPASVKFEVTLEPGRPRAKQDIESMFNHGGGDMGFTSLVQPASAMESFGEYNSARLAAVKRSSPGADPKSDGFRADARKSIEAVKATSSSNDLSSAENMAKYFKPRVAAKYGEGFGNSGILADYFTKIQTKG